MKTLHAKSSCCRASIYRFGNRRRQCIRCRHTWRIRPKRRGPKRKRISSTIVPRVIQKGVTVTSIARRRHCSPVAAQKHVKRAMEQFLRSPNKPAIPEGPLILIIDGMWLRFHNSGWHIMYLLALRAVNGNVAYFVLRTYKVASRQVRDAVLIALQETVCTTNESRLLELQDTLRTLSENPACPWYPRMQIREFLRYLNDFRTYLRYPELHLPITTNTVETMIRLLRHLLRQSHGFKTPSSAHRWITTFIRLKRTIACNGKTLNQN